MYANGSWVSTELPPGDPGKPVTNRSSPPVVPVGAASCTPVSLNELTERFSPCQNQQSSCRHTERAESRKYRRAAREVPAGRGDRDVSAGRTEISAAAFFRHLIACNAARRQVEHHYFCPKDSLNVPLERWRGRPTRGRSNG
jgi:hypothetical protein